MLRKSQIGRRLVGTKVHLREVMSLRFTDMHSGYGVHWESHRRRYFGGVSPKEGEDQTATP
jgi:hypothetical protein